MELLEGLVDGVGSAAMLLAMTKTIAAEQQIKTMLVQKGYKLAVTELGGNSIRDDLQTKLAKSVIGAVLNNNVIMKETPEIHAVVHAALEAKQSITMNVFTATNIAVKIAIVRKERWVAVAIFGQSALYHMTNHEKAGLGIMHI